MPRLFALIASLALASCLSTDGTTGMPEEGCGEGMQMDLDVKVAVTSVDLLLVIDNSMSMDEEQESLAQALPTLVGLLLDPGPQAVPVSDIHIGVVSTDVGTGGRSIETCSDPVDGDNGELLNRPPGHLSGCDGTYPLFLSNHGSHDPALIDGLGHDIGCLARLGTDGCGWEQQLEASYRALVTHREGLNAGFLRGDSILVVIFLTDEEDCSVAPDGEVLFDTLRSDLGHLCLRCYHHPHLLEPVQKYVEAFRSLRPDPLGLMVAFITGVPVHADCLGLGSEIPACLENGKMIETIDPVSMTRLVPSCVTPTGQAFPPRRMVRLAQALGEGAFVSSICTDDFTPTMRDLASILHGRISSATPLVPLPVRKDPLDSGLCRASCTLTDARDPETPIPQVASRLSDPSLACDDPSARLEPTSGSGWVYRPSTPGGPQIRFTGGIAPRPSSVLHLECFFDGE